MIKAYCLIIYYSSNRGIYLINERGLHMKSSPEYNKKFGEIVKAKRQKKGISQTALAKSLNISEVYLRDIEYGNYCITWQLWLTICNTLNIDVNKLKELFVDDSERKE